MSLILDFDGDARTFDATALAAAASAVRPAAEPWRHGRIARHEFPDGEVRLSLPAPALPARVVLLRALHGRPGAMLAELLLAAAGARELGARHLTLVAPYLAYMRQDMAFTPGEVVSQRHVAGLLAASFDRVVTVDPHLHRIDSLDEVMPAGQGVALGAAPLLGALVAERVPQALVIGPDEEAAQWAAAAAAPAGLTHANCRKLRRGDRDVVVTAPPELAVRGRAVVLVDDIASTGRTLAQAARALLAAGAASIDAAVTHALLVGDAMQQLRAAGIGRLWSADTVPHESNAVSVLPLLARALAAP